MGARVTFAQRAREDLREISSYIARNNPRRAKTFGRELILKAQSLGEHPRMGCVVLELDDEAVRETVHGAYRIIYRVTADRDRIFILRFWHGARGNPQIVED